MLLIGAGTLAQPRGAAAQKRVKPLDPRIDSLFPDRPTAYLTDLARIVQRPAQVNVRYAEIRDSLRLPVFAITLPSTHGYPPYEVAMEIGRRWMVAVANDTLGAATRHTGVVVLLVLDTHQCFIAAAEGSEGYLTDTEAHAICRAQNTAFRAGDFGGALVAIGDSLAAHAAADLAAAPPVRAAPAVARPPEPPPDGRLPFLFALVAIVTALAAATFFSARRRSTAERERLSRLTPTERRSERSARRRAERAARRAARRYDRDIADSDERRRRDVLAVDTGMPFDPSFESAPDAPAPDPGPSAGGSDAFDGGGGGGSWDS